MTCTWKEEQAYQFSDRSLAAESGKAFANHLNECAVCRNRVAGAERLDDLLRNSITPVSPPPTLMAGVSQALVTEREQRRRRSGWSLLFSRRGLATAAASLLLALGLVTIVAGPGTVLAVVQRGLFFIPGLGIKAVDANNLVAVAPVSTSQGNAVFTVEALLSDGQRTTVDFKVTGLPGGKQGWDSEDPAKRGQPRLRDANGHEYSITGSYHGVGGSLEENEITGRMYFATLPGDLKAIDLIVPVNFLVPAAVFPGADTAEWVAHVALTRPAESALSQAVAQNVTATVNGVTLRVTASNADADRTVILLEGEVEGQSRVLSVGEDGADRTAAATLRDDQGRTYSLIPQDMIVSSGRQPYRQDLYFTSLAAGVRQLTLEIPAVKVLEEGAATFTVPLNDRQVGDTFSLNQIIELGRHKILLKSATIVEERGKPCLFIDVDLGATHNGRTLSSFEIQGQSSFSSFGSGDVRQLDRVGVDLAPGAKQVEIKLVNPLVSVKGPWVLTFPARAN